MKLSVAICTYNGSKYIEEQLLSIINQTTPIDEICLSDDASADNTISIVERIALTTTIPIHIVKNVQNKGFYNNFIDTIKRCSGDIIFLSDQDDIWHSDKVEKVVSFFRFNPSKAVFFSNGELIDGNGVLLGENMFERVGFDNLKQKHFYGSFALDVLGWGNRITGATMAIKRDWVSTIDFQNENLQKNKLHDLQLALFGIIEKNIGFTTDNLIQYRLHGDNTLGLYENHPVHIYYPYYVPSHTYWDWESFLPVKWQKQCMFRRRRAYYERFWFGIHVCAHIFEYLYYYNGKWHIPFCYDLKMSMLQSFKRIKNKFSSRIKHN